MFAALAALPAFSASAFSFCKLMLYIILVSKLHDASPKQIKKFEHVIHFKKNNLKFIKRPHLRRLYFSSLTFDVAISAIPTTSKLILIGTGISWSPENIKIVLLKQNIIPLINLVKLIVFLSIAARYLRTPVPGFEPGLPP